MSAVPLSVLIATKDEESNIADCLRSAAFADEAVVLDSASRDRTQEIAHAMGATVVDFPGLDVAGTRKRTWAIDTYPFRNEWILVLDADERISDALQAELREVMSGEPPFDGYQIAFRYMFMGRWIRHCGWYPSYQLRLFRRGRGQYERFDMNWTDEIGDVEVHERIRVHGRVGQLTGLLIHDDYQGLGRWIEKHNRYSTWEAARRLPGTGMASGASAVRDLLRPDPIARRQAIRTLAGHVPLRPVATFLWMYVVKRGFLDGYPGLVFCVLHAVHQLHIDIKASELLTSTSASPA